MTDTAQRKQKLRAALLREQRELRSAHRSLVVLLEAPEHLSRAEVANVLGNWLDPRGVDFHAFRHKREEELLHPRLWRYWRTVPASGRIGVYVSGWYTGTLLAIDGPGFTTEESEHLARLQQLEGQLIREGISVLKLWITRSAHAQKQAIEHARPDDGVRWQVEPTDEQLLSNRNTLVRRAEGLMERTSTPAGWLTVDCDDPDERDQRVGRLVLKAMRRARETGVDSDASKTAMPTIDHPDLLNDLDTHPTLAKADYKARLNAELDRLKHLTWRAFDAGCSPVLVFEGFDAAGKGGVIRRLLQGIDARLVSVVPIAAPTDEEQRFPYLWRFWRELPSAGDTTIFDRSWYGRVLVERVEHLIDAAQCDWAYSEINDFESQLLEAGHLVMKFWLHIDDDEQLQRFHERERVPHKRHKIGPEDWRNREKRSAYIEAVNTMVHRTHSERAPWHLIPANDKRFARVEILRRIGDHLASMLEV